MLELLKIREKKMLREIQKELAILEDVKNDLPEHLKPLEEPLAAYIDAVSKYVDDFEQLITFYIRRQLEEGKV